MQRFFDILISTTALLFLSPFFFLVIFLLMFTGEGEVFYLQTRIGLNGKKFLIYKFATMLKDSPCMSTGTITIKDDFRILPLGKFLRKTKINELPQLLNVLNGDMSLIGPRPLTVETFKDYSESIQRIIKLMRPGISGLGSVIFRGEENIIVGGEFSTQFYGSIIAPYKGELEDWYYKNKSLATYFYLIFITLYVVARPKSTIVWKIFKNLPTPPDSLKSHLNYHLN